jgi:hypothetical protein
MLLFCACLNSLLTDSCQTGSEAFRRRYKIDVDSECGKTYALTDPLFFIQKMLF